MAIRHHRRKTFNELRQLSANPTTSRSRAPLALATVLALIAAMFSIGISPASADPAVPVYATVSGHQKFSSDANKVGYWCAEGGTKIAPGGNSYELPPGDYAKVIVKAGSGMFANTVFAAPPTAGQTVWADTNGDSTFNPGGKGGDKNISHIILCNGSEGTPYTTDLTVEKEWEYLGVQPDGFVLGNDDAGTLTVTVAGVQQDQTWGQLNDGLTVEDPALSALVSEGEVPDPDDPAGYRCVITGEPTYSINGAEPVKESQAFPLEPITNNVVVTNSVTCTEIITEPETTTLTVSKVWNYVTVPNGYTLTSANAGPLNVTVGGTTTGQAWGATATDLPVGGTATISEGAVPAPPSPANHTCKVTGAPEYSVNGGEFTSATPSFELLPADNAAKVQNTVTCTKDIPPPAATTTLTVTKVWVYAGGVQPNNYTLTSANAGVLTVTVGGTATGQGWGATQANLKVGDKASVTEGPVPTLPTAANYTCAVSGVPEYAVNGGGFTTTAESFPLAPSANTVTVRNTVACVAIQAVDDDEAVGGDEDSTPADDEAVGGDEDELAATGGSAGPAGLGFLLILSGAAFVTARRLALK